MITGTQQGGSVGIFLTLKAYSANRDTGGIRNRWVLIYEIQTSASNKSDLFRGGCVQREIILQEASRMKGLVVFTCLRANQ